MPSPKPRLRFAPSPTGQLHIGGARTALFNWAYARRMGGAMVLRIEDTDPTRSKKEYEVAILDGLKRMGMDWDEGVDVGGGYGPYRQTERYDRYREVADGLLQAGWSYPCYCTSERLTDLRTGQMERKENPRYDGHCKGLSKEQVAAKRAAGEQPTMRFRVPDGETTFHDMVRGDVTFQNTDVDDWIMVRADGNPTYNFVVVVDDSDMQISHVMRGEEHLTNTPKQVLIFKALGLDVPIYAHLPLMLGKDGKKLSKRTGDTALQAYLDNGYPPEAVLNFLCLQGWALDGETDLFSIDQLVDNFSPENVAKGGSIFDPEKFKWMAGEYIRMDSAERLADRCAPFMVDSGLMTPEQLALQKDWFVQAIGVEQQRFHIYSELPGRLAYCFALDGELEWEKKAEKNARKHAGGSETLLAFGQWLQPRFVDGRVTDAVQLGVDAKQWIADQGLKIPGLFQPLRCVLTGAAGGADLFEIIGLLGEERTMARISLGAERLAREAQSS